MGQSDAFTGLPQVATEFDRSNIPILIKSRMDRRDRLDTDRGRFQQSRRGGIGRAGLKREDGTDQLQRVLDPMVDLSQENLFFLDQPSLVVDIDQCDRRADRLAVFVADRLADDAHPEKRAVAPLVMHLQFRMLDPVADDTRKRILMALDLPAVGMK